MVYCSWDMARDRCNCHFSFWATFYPSTPLTCPKNKNFKKNMKKKTLGDIIILYMVSKIMIRWRNGWTDGRKKWHIEVGAPTKIAFSNMPWLPWWHYKFQSLQIHESKYLENKIQFFPLVKKFINCTLELRVYITKYITFPFVLQFAWF